MQFLFNLLLFSPCNFSLIKFVKIIFIDPNVFFKQKKKEIKEIRITVDIRSVCCAIDFTRTYIVQIKRYKIITMCSTILIPINAMTKKFDKFLHNSFSFLCFA